MQYWRGVSLVEYKQSQWAACTMLSATNNNKNKTKTRHYSSQNTNNIFFKLDIPLCCPYWQAVLVHQKQNLYWQVKLVHLQHSHRLLQLTA